MSGSREKRFSDSQGEARIVQDGSMHFNLHNLASDIFAFCSNHGINLNIEWVLRSQNEKAHRDYLSKIIYDDDWQLFPEIFKLLDGRWGPHTVDCFATFYYC